MLLAHDANPHLAAVTAEVGPAESALATAVQVIDHLLRLRIGAPP
jgi:hypothetical protein